MSQSLSLTREPLARYLYCLISADKYLNPELYTLNSCEAVDYGSIVNRNLNIITAFEEIFDENTLQGLTDIELNKEVQEIIISLREVSGNDLLYIPGVSHESALDTAKSRKQQGSYYTPPHIIQFMVESALEQVIDNDTVQNLCEIKVLDPACGGGFFLLEIWNALVLRGLSETEAIRCIFGTDIDQQAVNTTVFILTMAVLAKIPSGDAGNIKALWQQQVTNCSALTGKQLTLENRYNEFDLVVGNPPYVANKLISTQNKKFYKDNYSVATGQYDLSILFFEQGLELLKENGVVTYINSNKFLAADYGRKLREKLINECRITEIIDISLLKSFRGTSVYPVIISFIKLKPDPGHLIRFYNIRTWEELAQSKPELIHQKLFATNSQYIISTQLNSCILPILNKLENSGERIDGASIKCGIAQSGFNKWIVKKTDVTEEANYHQFIQAGHIEAFTLKDPDFINTSRFDPARWLKHRGPKLVIPGISRELKASVDDNEYLLGRVYFIKQSETKYDLNYLCVLFNSSVLNFYYKVMYWPVHLEGGYLRFNSTYLANLPIPAIMESKFKQQIAAAMQQIAVEMRRNPEAERFNDLKTRADALTFLIYDFSEDEAEVVLNYLEKPARIKEQTRKHILGYRESIKNDGTQA